MKFSLKKICNLIFLFLIIGIIPIQKTQSFVLSNTLHSYAGSTPIIDDIFESSIWDEPKEEKILLYDIELQSNSLEISVKSVFDETSGNITFSITIPDTSANIDIFWFVFRTNSTNELVYYDNDWAYGLHQDMKIFYTFENKGHDGYTFWNNIDGNMDIVLSGQNDVFARGTHDGSKYQIEMTTPLDSGDRNGTDFNLALNDQIEFTVFYLEDTSDIYFTQIRESDNDFDYCILKIGKSGLLGFSISELIFGLISLVMVSSIVIRYKNHRKK